MKEQILKLTKQLISIPSQGGIDTCESIIKFLLNWGEENKLKFRILKENDITSGLLIEIDSGSSGPTICLNACLDTAPTGDKSLWKFDPFNPVEHDNWLYGRGAADSKIAIAIFLHIAKEIGNNKLKRGKLHILFDAEEHTGKFLGIKSYIKQYPKPDGVYIGYPGHENINIGSRGFYRAKITFRGVSEHSGASQSINKNPIYYASSFARKIENFDTSKFNDISLGKEPKLSITKINAGTSYTITPNSCEVFIDARLNTIFNSTKAREIIKIYVEEIIDEYKLENIPNIQEEESWPPYKLNENHFLAKTLFETAVEFFDETPNYKVSGPSNIGNYLAQNGIPAISGYGVKYENIHALDEKINTNDVETIYQIYLSVINKLLK